MKEVDEELKKKHKGEKIQENEKLINETLDKIKASLTDKELKNLPKKGGYRYNLMNTFLKKFSAI